MATSPLSRTIVLYFLQFPDFRLPRIRVAQIVMDYLAYGWSVEEMCRQHSYLRLAEVYAAMGYYFDHQDEIDNEVCLEWEQAQQAKIKNQYYRKQHDKTTYT